MQWHLKEETFLDNQGDLYENSLSETSVEHVGKGSDCHKRIHHLKKEDNNRAIKHSKKPE